jgi:hypothetical protein
MLKRISIYGGFLMLRIVGLMLITSQGVQAQSPEKKALELLKSEGFEEIRLLEQDTVLVCTLERGLHRSPASDLSAALRVLNSVYNSHPPIHIFLLEQGQPVYELSAAAQGTSPSIATQEPSNVSISWADLDFYQSIRPEQVHRSVHSGITLVIYPQLTLQNMRFDHIYEKQFNLAPALTYSPWSGMLLTAQVIFPLLNQLTYEGDFIRPGFVTLSQGFQLPGHNQLRLTAGNFNHDRYGVDLKWKKHFDDSRWSLAANMGLTGKSIYYDQYWNHSSLDRFSWNLKASYYLPVYQLRADVLAGQFLYGDKGVRFDLYRHFGEVTIGFYANYTGYHPNGGFHFAIPLDPFNRRHQHRVRVMLPSYFDMEYNARNEFVYNRYYETSPNENRSEEDLYPQYINSQFYNIQNKQR